MIWVGVLPEFTHLDHWSSHRLVLIRPTIFFNTISVILLLGPLSIVALWSLKNGVLALEEKEKGGRKFWNPSSKYKGNPDPVGTGAPLLDTQPWQAQAYSTETDL